MPPPLTRAAIRARAKLPGARNYSSRSEIRLSQEATEIIARYGPVERPCITCTVPMVSTGPHHRMCDYCRAKKSAIVAV